MHATLYRVTALVALTTAAALVFASPAGATSVSGTQTIVDQAAGTYEMSGDLVGDWAITSFTELAQTPVYRAEGTEKFKGCLDGDSDGSCRGEPSGNLKFSFDYWAQLADDGSLELGTCAHRVTRGKGDFAKAKGFLMFVDTPTSTAPFVETEYEGVINLKHHRSSKSRTAGFARGAC
jgi:hypothetical protein